MSTVPFNDALQPDVSPGSMQTLVSRPLQPHSDPVTSKRVCFYKSGDPQFAGHRMVINSRTFKTFDALLDALSKKVPLSFGVRTITTPKGTHAVRTLDDLQDGASYLCSDRKKVKPFNLDQVHRTHVPWNTTRPISAGRQARRALVRQLVKRGEGTTKTVKMPENGVVVRTPKRLTVYKNKDPSIKRVIVLQRRTAPNFETLLDYLSKVMQFPVLKLYTEYGRKVDGLSALILCSGIVVAAGNEPFRMGNYNLQGPTKTIRSNISESLGPTETLLDDKNKPAAPISRSRNFSLSSERYLVEQINKSLNGSLSEHNWQKTESMETEGSQPIGPEENCDSMANVEKRNPPIMPTEDDIEKSFRVNEDGSMTVEMKVHLTIKQEEMVHWTTTLSRTSVNNQQRAVGTSKSGSGVNSLDIANDESNGPHSLECKEINTLTDKSVGFIEEEQENYGKAVSQTSEKLKPIYRRLPTPGHRQQCKETSISQTEVQESTLGSYSYMERTAQGELTEGYCVVSRSSSNSNSTRTLSKPSKSESGEIKQKKSHSFRSSGVAEVLQLNNNGTIGITETVLHIYESQGTCDNYYANTQVDVENKPEYCTKVLPRSRPGSTDSGPRSSSNDCDVDLTRQSTSSNSGDGGRNDMLSLSSASSTPLKTVRDNPQILSDNGQQASEECRSPESTENKMLQPIDEDCNDMRIIRNKNTNTPKSKKSKQSTSSESSGNGKRIKGGIQGSSKGLQMLNTSETLSHTESEKKTNSSAESAKHKNGRDQSQKTKTFEGTPKSRNVNLKRRSEKVLKTKDKTIKDMSHKVNTSDCVSLGSTLKTNALDNRSPSHPAPIKKILPKQRSMNSTKSKASTQKQKLSESVSLPVLQSSPSNVNQYVENWLQKIQPDSLPYDDDMEHTENVPRPVFQIGCESADGSEIKSEPEKDLVDEGPSLEHNAVERPVSRPPVQIRCEGEPLEAQRVRGFCKSMPSVRVLPAEQEDPVRMHKSSENLAPPDPCTGAGTSLSTDFTGSGVKPVLKQLCLSVQSITRASSQTLLEPTMKEKSSSLPDFSSQVASAFGSPTRAFLSFLSLMTLRDGKSILGKDESQDSDSEALQVMQSLEKISNIKDEEELKASLTSLQSSTSSQLKQSWRDFQEKNAFGESPPLSPRQSEQEFALDVDSGGEGDEQDEQGDFGIEQLMDELNMSGDLRKEISSLVAGEPKKQTNVNDGHTSEISVKEEENDEGSVNGSLEKATDMEMEKDYCKENVGLENERTNDEMTDDPKEAQELHSIQSNSQDLETVKQDLVIEDSGIAGPNQTHGENCSDLSEAEILENADNNQTETEIVIYGDSDNGNAEQNHLQTPQQNLTDTAGEDLSLSDIENGDLSEEEEATILSDVLEPDITDDTSKQKVTNLAEDEQLDFSEREINTTPDNLEENEANEETDTIQSIKEHSEQSEPENTDDILEQKVTYPDGDEQCEFSDGQYNVSERDNMTPDNLEEREANEEMDGIESINEHFEQSDVSEPDNTDISEQNVTNVAGDEQPEFSEEQDNVSERDNMTPDNLEEKEADEELDNIESIKEHSEQSDVSEPENTDISEQNVTNLDGDEQPEFSDEQDNVSERDNMTPDNLEEREANGETDTNQSIKEYSEQSDVSEPENTDDISEQKVKYPDADEQPEFSDEQDNVSERDNMTPDNLDERKANEELDIQSTKEHSEQSDVSELDVTDDTSKQKVTYSARDEEFDDQDNVCEGDNNNIKETDTLENFREHSEQSDFSEPEDLCLASETECVEILDKETAKLNEDGESQSSTAEIQEQNCVGEETDHSDFEEDDGDGDEEENKCVLAECDVESQNSQHSLSHHCDLQSKHRVHEFESDSQDDNEVIPDVKDAIPKMSECEDLDPNFNKSSPECCNNYENSMDTESKCKTEYDEMQQIDDSFVEQRNSNDEDHEISEDPDAEANSNPEVKNVTSRSSTSDLEHVCKVQTLDKGNHADKNETSAELYNPENSMADSPNFSQHSFMCKDDINGINGLESESCSSKKTNSSERKLENLGMEHGYHYLLHPTEISQELLDLINSALLSSTLTVKYDSNGHLRIEQDKCKIRDMFRAQQRANDQYGKKRLPSPYTSDLSDYRPETSDNSGYQSQASMEPFTESDEEEKRLRIFSEVLKQSSVNPQNHVMGSSSVKSSSSLNSNNSRTFNQKSDLQDPLHYNRPTTRHGNSTQGVTVNGDVDSKEGVLIDKGRWLLKENHLIRKSPPVTMGMYGNGDTTSPDTGLDNISEDAPYPYYANQNSPLAVISSSELEDLAKPPTPKCMYFNVPHSSGSDLLSDAQSLNGATAGRSSRKNKELRVSPMGESWAKKNGSLSSFASVEFKLPDGKVHPQDRPVSVAVNANTSQSIDSRTMQEEESRVGLNLRCGQNCPIL